MSSEEKLASITNDGAILMGNLFCCDGHSYDRDFFAFSHMHRDHTEKLPKCLYNGQVFMSKPTRDLLEAIHNENYGSEANMIKKNQIRILDYGQSEIISNGQQKEKITFYKSEHVLGASQIEIIADNGAKKIVYSGDITSNDTPPKNIHTLVLDSTHGHPKYDKVSEPESVERRFLEKIDDVIHSDQAQPVVIHAHQGKLQEIISLISQHDELKDFPLHTSDINIRIANVYKKYGFKIRNKIIDDKSEFAESHRDSDWPYIQCISSFSKKMYEINGKAHSIFLYDSLPSGQQIDDAKNNTTKYATTAHADFENVVNYVKEAQPKFVIVDNHRTKQAQALTGKLQSKGFTVEFQPLN